jgi:hypothetical protein
LHPGGAMVSISGELFKPTTILHDKYIYDKSIYKNQRSICVTLKKLKTKKCTKYYGEKETKIN